MTSPTWKIVAEQDPGRLRALEPYLKKLGHWNEKSAQQDGTIERTAHIRVGGRTLCVEGWERKQLRIAFQGEESTDRDAARMLAQAIALLTKSLVDIERFNDMGGRAATDFFALEAELMLDSAIGSALLDETQNMLDALVGEGQVEPARRLSELRHKLHRTVLEVKRLIADSEAALARRHSLSAAPPAGPAPSAAVADPALDELAERVAEEVEQADPTPHPQSAGPVAIPVPAISRTRFLATVLFLMIVAWAGLVELPRKFGGAPPSSVPAELRGSTLYVEVRSRPPSLFLTVRSESWSDLSAAQRRDAVTRAGRSAATQGYTGVVFLTERHRPVGRWLAATGTNLVVSAEGPRPLSPP